MYDYGSKEANERQYGVVRVWGVVYTILLWELGVKL